MTQTMQAAGRLAKQPEPYVLLIAYGLYEIAKDAEDTVRFVTAVAAATLIAVAYITGRAYLNTRK